MKKILCLVLVCLLTLSFYPAVAADPVTMSEFEIVDGVLCGYHGPGGEVTIPDGVTEIRATAMSGIDSLTSVVLPASIRRIGVSAFEDCKNLKTVVLPEGLLLIDGFAFAGCNALESIYIPDSVLSIDAQAFAGCSSLASVRLPSTTKTWSRGVPLFAGTPWGEKNTVTIHEPMSTTSGSWRYTSVEPAPPIRAENGFLMRGDIVVGCDSATGELVIPEGVIAIGTGAFAGNTEITAVQLPDSIQMIGASAFEGCTGLRRVEPEIKETLFEILPDTFAGCTALEYIDLPYAVLVSDSAFTGTKFLSDNGRYDGFPMVEYAFAPSRSYDERFCDVPQNAWYHDRVAKAYESGILDGCTADHYEPDAFLTVAEAVKINAVIHAVGRGQEGRLQPSVPWYQTYFDYYSRRGPFSFFDGVDPSRPIRRDEFAALAYYTLPSAQWSRDTGSNGEEPFNDVSSDNIYRDEIHRLYEGGVLSGYSDGGFHPASALTRGETAAIISRIMYPELRLPIKQ